MKKIQSHYRICPFLVHRIQRKKNANKLENSIEWTEMSNWRKLTLFYSFVCSKCVCFFMETYDHCYCFCFRSCKSACSVHNEKNRGKGERTRTDNIKSEHIYKITIPHIEVYLCTHYIYGWRQRWMPHRMFDCERLRSAHKFNKVQGQGTRVNSYH